MPIYTVEVAVVCDDLEEDGIIALAAITDALGLDPAHDDITLEHGTDDSGHPVLIATLSASDPPKEETHVDGNSNTSRNPD